MKARASYDSVKRHVYATEINDEPLGDIRQAVLRTQQQEGAINNGHPLEFRRRDGAKLLKS